MSNFIPGHHGHHPASPTRSSNSTFSRLKAFPHRSIDVALESDRHKPQPDQSTATSGDRTRTASSLDESVASSSAGLTANLGHRPELTNRSSSRLAAVLDTVKATRRLDMNSSSSISSRRGRPPGIDPRRVDLPTLKCPCVIQVVDCSKSNAEFQVFDNDSIGSFLKNERPESSKLRYIHVNGLSWDVIKLLGIHYNLHPLSLEDMLHHDHSLGNPTGKGQTRRRLILESARSKADYFQRHLFVSLDVRKLAEEEFEPDSLDAVDEAAREEDDRDSGKKDQHDEEMVIESSSSAGSGGGALGQNRRSSSSADENETSVRSHARYSKNLARAFDEITASLEKRNSEMSANPKFPDSDRYASKEKSKKSRLARLARSEGRAAQMTVDELTKDVKVQVSVEQLSIFLLLDGTVISFSQDPGFHPQISSIFDRIASKDDLIRDSEDTSMVLQALLDVIVDDALEIVDDFRDRLIRLEARVLATPDSDDVRQLHVLSSQMIQLKSTFMPIRFLISSLRTDDKAKYAATLRGNGTTSSSSTMTAASSDKTGYISHQAQIYLGDVLDHIESVLANIELFGDLAENLISFSFNVSSAAANSYMQALSVLSACFLPLTFLSGYFGMNFEYFPHVLDGSVSYFWSIAIPVSIGSVIIFSWAYIKNMIIGVKRDLVRLNHRRLVSKHDKYL